jgi:hypothetical protein
MEKENCQFCELQDYCPESGRRDTCRFFRPHPDGRENRPGIEVRPNASLTTNELEKGVVSSYDARNDLRSWAKVSAAKKALDLLERQELELIERLRNLRSEITAAKRHLTMVSLAADHVTKAKPHLPAREFFRAARPDDKPVQKVTVTKKASPAAKPAKADPVILTEDDLKSLFDE